MKKTIKKLALYTCTLSVAVLLISSNSNAQVISTQAGTSGGTTVTIPDTNGSGPGLTYNPSPNVLMSVSSSATAYAINSMNSSIADGDRNEYAVWSGNTGYYQGTNANSNTSGTVVVADFLVDLADDTGLATTPFGGLTNIGGGGS